MFQNIRLNSPGRTNLKKSLSGGASSFLRTKSTRKGVSNIEERRYDWESIADDLRAQGLTEQEIEEARISFQKGIKLLLKMYQVYEAKHLMRNSETSCNGLSNGVV